MTPKRVIAKCSSSADSVWPSSRKSSSSRVRRVGSASALNTSSMRLTIGDQLVTCLDLGRRGQIPPVTDEKSDPRRSTSVLAVLRRTVTEFQEDQLGDRAAALT